MIQTESVLALRVLHRSAGLQQFTTWPSAASVPLFELRRGRQVPLVKVCWRALVGTATCRLCNRLLVNLSVPLNLVRGEVQNLLLRAAVILRLSALPVLQELCLHVLVPDRYNRLRVLNHDMFER